MPYPYDDDAAARPRSDHVDRSIERLFHLPSFASSLLI